jgi:short-subunit dehydrogenase
MANVECNAISAMQVTHVFVTRMLAKQLRGCVVFTSSAAACQPGPFSSMYGATKAFLSSFGASIAIELRSRGVDVTVVHPSPVASRFYENAHKLDAIAFFNQFNVSPDALPDLIFASVGRAVWRDIGGVAVAFRLLMKLVVRRAPQRTRRPWH